MEVGMRLTDYVMHSQQKEAENERKWNDLAGFPWAWEGLPEVVTALDGKIV